MTNLNARIVTIQDGHIKSHSRWSNDWESIPSLDCLKKLQATGFKNSKKDKNNLAFLIEIDCRNSQKINKESSVAEG